jgi:SOS-response transcriptional repressor LexA
MDKLVGEDGLIIVDPDQRDLINGKLYCVRNIAGEATFKRYRADPPQLEPMSSNPYHTAIPLGREPFIVIGRVTYTFNRC